MPIFVRRDPVEPGRRAARDHRCRRAWASCRRTGAPGTVRACRSGARRVWARTRRRRSRRPAISRSSWRPAISTGSIPQTGRSRGPHRCATPTSPRSAAGGVVVATSRTDGRLYVLDGRDGRVVRTVHDGTALTGVTLRRDSLVTASTTARTSVTGLRRISAGADQRERRDLQVLAGGDAFDLSGRPRRPRPSTGACGRRRCARPSCPRSSPSRRGWSCWAGPRARGTPA